MIEIRRASDGELCGFVQPSGSEWQYLAVFGATLGAHPDRQAAKRHVLTVGLASLAERWWYREDPTSEWQIACIQEANPDSVRLALDYYSMPGVPTVTVTRQQLAAGVGLTLTPP